MGDTADVDTQADNAKRGRIKTANPFRTWLVVVVLFGLSLIPRLHAVWQGFITPDEPFWIFSSMRFLRALETQHWTETFQIGHPGVTTMWVGTLSILWQRWRDAAGTAAHLAWVDPVPWIAPENAALFPHLTPFLPTARIIIATLTSLGVVGVYLLARKLLNDPLRTQIALIGAILLAFDPFSIALSGLLHVDALATTFVTLSLLAWLIALKKVPPRGGDQRGGEGKKRSWPWLFALFSGLCAGLATLSKFPTAFIAAIVPLAGLLAFLGSPSRKSLGRIAFLELIWGIAAAIAIVGIFPGMWQDPVGMAGKVYDLIARYGAEAHEITFFRGISGGDPGVGFYPTVFWFRLMPATWIGLIFSLIPLLSHWHSPEHNRQRQAMLSLWAFAIGYPVLLSFGAKKFDRYLLPAFPALNLLAAIGWVHITDGLYRWARRQKNMSPANERGTNRDHIPQAVFVALLIVLLIAQTAMVVGGWPYYFDTYNPLSGGLKAALQTLPVGWGEGLEQIAEYLNRQSDAAERTVAGASPVTLGPLVRGKVMMLGESSRLLADNILITALDRQNAPHQVAQAISGAEIEYVVRAGGQDVLWLYKAAYRAEVEHLDRYGAPGDAILCDAPTPFARHHPDVYFFERANEDEIALALNDWSAAHTRLWYFSYSVASPITRFHIRHQLDTFAAKLDEIDLGYVTATLYILPGEPAFTPSTDDVADFGSLAVKGAVLVEQEIAADDVARFVIRWQAETAPDADYAPFLHLVDQAGHLRSAGRGDDVLVDDRYWPTSAWSPGNEAELTYSLGLPPGLPPGSYQIHLGISNAETGEWMPALDEQDRIVGTTAHILDVNIQPAKVPPDPTRLQLPHPQNVTWRNQIKLTGVDYPIRANVGETVVIGVSWLALNTFDQSYDIKLSLSTDDDGTALTRTLPLSQYPTVKWRRNEAIHELYDLELHGKADGNRFLQGKSYTLSIEVLDENGTRLSPPVEIGKIDIAVEERIFELPSPPQVQLELHLGEAADTNHPADTNTTSPITLIGYDISSYDREQLELEPGQVLSLTLYWQCNTLIETSYTVFVHLLDANGQVHGQSDQLPMKGRMPTSGWIEGQVVLDTHTLTVSNAAQPGSYHIEAGMYDLQTMTRLPIVESSGSRLPDDRALLDSEIVIVEKVMP